MTEAHEFDVAREIAALRECLDNLEAEVKRLCEEVSRAAYLKREFNRKDGEAVGPFSGDFKEGVEHSPPILDDRARKELDMAVGRIIFEAGLKPPGLGEKDIQEAVDRVLEFSAFYVWFQNFIETPAEKISDKLKALVRKGRPPMQLFEPMLAWQRKIKEKDDLIAEVQADLADHLKQADKGRLRLCAQEKEIHTLREQLVAREDRIQRILNIKAMMQNMAEERGEQIKTIRVDTIEAAAARAAAFPGTADGIKIARAILDMLGEKP